MEFEISWTRSVPLPMEGEVICAFQPLRLADGHDFIRVGCDDYIGQQWTRPHRRVHASDQRLAGNVTQHFLGKRVEARRAGMTAIASSSASVGLPGNACKRTNEEYLLRAG